MIASAITDTFGGVAGRSFFMGPPAESAEVNIFILVNRQSNKSYEMMYLLHSQEDAYRLAFEQRTNNLAADTSVYSSLQSITRHPEFSALLRMGSSAIKFTLERLARGDFRVYWFPLLKRLSGEDPVRPEYRGVVNRMAEEWIRWGQSKGHLAKDAA